MVLGAWRNCPTFSSDGITRLTPFSGHCITGLKFLSVSALALAGSRTRKLKRMITPDSTALAAGSAIPHTASSNAASRLEIRGGRFTKGVEVVAGLATTAGLPVGAVLAAGADW